MHGEKLLLIDGAGLAYRSYFAFARDPLKSSAGEPTSVPFGFARALAKIVEEEIPDYWAVAFDHPAPTFRHVEFSDYKANRPSMPEEMKCQLGRVVELLEALRVPRLELEGYEADDIIGTLAVKAAGLGVRVLLVADDKDFCQIVSHRIHLLSLPKGGQPQTTLDPDGVRKKLGVPPEKVVDLLALAGDASDNVPGVRGVGLKTATRLLGEFSSLHQLYEQIERVDPPRLREKLLEGKDAAFMSRRLVTLALDAPVAVGLPQLRRSAPDADKLVALLRELEFTRLARAFLSGSGAASARRTEAGSVSGPRRPDGGPGPALEDGAPLGVYLKHSGAGTLWAFAVGPDSRGQMGIAICGSSGTPYRVASEGESNTAGIRDFLAGEACRKAVHDLKAEAHAALGVGWVVKGVVSDVMLASYLLGPEDKHDLESLAARYLGSGAPQGDGVTASDVLKWKAGAVRRLDELLAPRIAQEGMEGLLKDIEVPLAMILMEMEREGVALDSAALEKLSSRLEAMMGRGEEDIYCMAGTEFNINSPQQLSEVLFGRLGLPAKRRTKTGYSTDSSVLEELAQKHELPREILNYRQLVKLKSAYADALPRMIDSGTGRVHATFHQAVTATGRLSSSNPNLQNIPIRSDLGKEIRKAFVPGTPDGVLMSADYSQIELRIMAHLSGDEALRESFVRGVDAHAATAAVIFGVPVDKVDEGLRARAKTVNYGVMYGMGAVGLAKTLGISTAEAARFIEDYFAKMPAVRSFLASLIEKARRDGHATTILNRRRPLPAIHSSDRRMRAYAERMAVNTPIQGSAADIIKKAMVEMRRLMGTRSLASRLILQVHDELVFECPKAEVDEMSSLVTGAMESAVRLTVPLSVTVGVGANWWEAHR